MRFFRHLAEAEPLDSMPVLSQLYSCIEFHNHPADLTCELLNRNHQSTANPTTLQVWPDGELTDVQRGGLRRSEHAAGKITPSVRQKEMLIARLLSEGPDVECVYRRRRIDPVLLVRTRRLQQFKRRDQS